MTRTHISVQTLCVYPTESIDVSSSYLVKKNSNQPTNGFSPAGQTFHSTQASEDATPVQHSYT